jgi:hypothetical protein
MYFLSIHWGFIGIPVIKYKESSFSKASFTVKDPE